MAEASSAGNSPKRLQIRKYPNRRYYDTTRSRHVTLEEIYALIREGYEVQITDSKSGHDITPKVLAQIIIELDAPKLDVFPVPMLHRLLRANREIVNDFVEKYFNQPLTAFLDSQRNMEQYFRQAMGFQNPAPTMADWAKMMWGPFNPNFWGGGGGGGGSSAGGGGAGAARANAAAAEHVPGAGAGAGAAAVETDDRELRKQIDALRQQVSELQRELGSRAGSANGGGGGGGGGGGQALVARTPNDAHKILCKCTKIC